jgi:fermentation-respiration switch protein FrsA (DUF1100 family)
MHRSFYLLLLLALLSGCTSLFFQPASKTYVTPKMLHVQSDDVYFDSDGLRLHGWWLHASSAPKGIVVFAHGNAENISTHIGSVYWLPAQGYDVFLFDYRGYGLSQGVPTLDGIHHDFNAALKYVYDRTDIDKTNVFVFGQSLGAAVVLVDIATSPYKSRLRAVIAEGAFTGYRSIAREKLASSWLTWLFQWPLSFTIDDDYRPIDAVAQISPTPLLLIHSEVDKVIPFHNARELYAAAHEPKTLWVIKDMPHIHTFNDPENQHKLVRYLDQHLAH